MADFSFFYFHPETATVLALVAARTNPKTKLLTPVGVQLARKKAFLSGFVDLRAGKSFWTLKNFRNYFSSCCGSSSDCCVVCGINSQRVAKLSNRWSAGNTTVAAIKHEKQIIHIRFNYNYARGGTYLAASRNGGTRELLQVWCNKTFPKKDS